MHKSSLVGAVAAVAVAATSAEVEAVVFTWVVAVAVVVEFMSAAEVFLTWVVVLSRRRMSMLLPA